MLIMLDLWAQLTLRAIDSCLNRIKVQEKNPTDSSSNGETLNYPLSPNKSSTDSIISWVTRRNYLSRMDCSLPDLLPLSTPSGA